MYKSLSQSIVVPSHYLVRSSKWKGYVWKRCSGIKEKVKADQQSHTFQYQFTNLQEHSERVSVGAYTLFIDTKRRGTQWVHIYTSILW